MRSRIGAVLAILASLALFAGAAAGCTSPATQLVVVVDTDLAIPGEVDQVSVTVEGPSGAMETERSTLADRSRLPLTLGVSPSGDALGPITVTAMGRHVGTLVVLREHRVTLVRGETRMLVMHLSAECVGASAPSCDDTETCTDRGCEAVEVDATRLPAWTGTPPSLRDAGPSPDGGRSDGGRGDAGADAAAGCSTADDCNDGNPCTDDVCTATGCRNPENTVACDDRVFCNGLDTCAAGTCSVHAGNPCGGATTCSEALGGRCEGCRSDTDCPTPTYGAYGACEFSDGCAVNGEHARTVRRFTCTAGSCVPSDSPERTTCSRASTDGRPCASRTCAAEGPCGGFSDECDETGEATRSCFEGVCSAGSCSTVPVTETVSCSRSTNGAACGPGGGCGGWSACTGFAEPCGTSGTRSRSCQDRGTCGGGSCSVPGPRTETEGCGRSTDGVVCGGDVCGGWSGCSYASECALGGAQTRTCQPQVCGGGSCGLGGARTETDTASCARSTEGWACEDGDWCTYGDYCSGGWCYGGWYSCGGW